MSKTDQRGASAVEFAIVLPLLLTLLLGIIEFGFLFNQQISLTQAAREGARAYAIHHGELGFNLTTAAQNAAPSLGPVNADAGAGCDSDNIVRVTVSRSYSSITGWFDFLSITKLEGKGAMRCGG
ncbi:hypothetical protein GCM10009715_39470 [Paeniglutamicibacter psychrophenolicus]|uniref:Flp pilus assembly protein TadG n=1 Tax=Paeniglutamicibacter psychrophenolicus TaxID=257454 RepID=A0ABS4WJ97_9MICC|nr:TadE/TadG family type IV pilus assembly protein [Paeniglutamicibacter psychrophenolicus]MBP2376043.1 Flp pilus assembly protein TadG [Paeniglutamicibacter psychrophenolicus]